MLKKYAYKSENALITPFHAKNNLKSNNVHKNLAYFTRHPKHTHNPF